MKPIAFVTISDPAAKRMILEQLSHKQLQRWAKVEGIPCSRTKISTAWNLAKAINLTVCILIPTEKLRVTP